MPPLSVYNSIAAGGSAEGGQAILVGGGYINWCYGRNGWAIQVTYINGWPHCSLTSAVAAGVTSLPVNDCTGWAITDYYGTTGATGGDQGLRAAGSRPCHRRPRSPPGRGTSPCRRRRTTRIRPGRSSRRCPPAIEQACIYFCHRRSPHQGRDVHDDPRGRRRSAVLRRRGAGADRRGRASAVTPIAGRSEGAPWPAGDDSALPAAAAVLTTRGGPGASSSRAPAAAKDPTTAPRQRSQLRHRRRGNPSVRSRAASPPTSSRTHPRVQLVNQRLAGTRHGGIAQPPSQARGRHDRHALGRTTAR